ncbi:Highly reducing polyketide synthase gloL [Cladobotryum mycophilum]|uniref:Highly reducing polyketide synthase gloL n=1 Tax=Cladobotryum mycophilum TaxID=491253 RepID=A0ABR0S4V1_9HYPO
MAPKKDTPPLIAIIGIGLRLPGDISTTEDFWNFLIEKRDGKCPVPTDRYDVSALIDQTASRQRVAAETGYFLNVNLKAFDNSHFVVPPKNLEGADPQQRLLIEVVKECVDNAGQSNLLGTNVGVYVGNFGEDWQNMMHMDPQSSPGTNRITGAGDYFLANNLSHTFDFRGPSMTVRTACSASMTSLHLACQALYNGDCPVAVVAGSSLIMSPSMTMDMSEQGVLSPTGSCHVFDANADGFARGEAINAILIKPLDDALRDNDPIRAIIRATAVNSDGGTTAVTVPSQVCQEAMIRRAYEVAGISDITQTPFVECHGTGTQTGDPIETKSVANVFGGKGTYIGSVKSNVGHAEGAAGINSIIKAVLALENETIPPNIHFSTPNPNIPFEQGKLQVPVEPVPWPKDRPARISINSFGIGGANAHVILDSAASHGIRQSPSVRIAKREVPASTSSQQLLAGTNGIHHEPDRNGNAISDENANADDSGNGVTKPSDGDTWRLPYLIPLSASTADATKRRISDIRRYTETQKRSIDALAYTLSLRRTHASHRSFAIAETLDKPLEFSPIQKAASVTPDVVFIFTGQGAQWVGMGKDLIHDCISFHDDIQEMDRVLQNLPEPPTWTIKDVICSDMSKELMDTAEFAQPICTAVQVALVNFLAKCGVTPSAVVGHSSGEIGAAYAAGSLTLAQAIICAFYRGLVMKRQTRVGRMAAVALSPEAVKPYLANGVEVACENSPQSVTISGDAEGVENTVKTIEAANLDVFVRQLRVDIAYHSYHMQESGQIYEDLIKGHLSGKETTVPFYSSVTGHLITSKMDLGPAYWRSNLESPVLFNSAIQTLLTDFTGQITFLEVGPHSALQGPLQQIFQRRPGTNPRVYTPTLIRNSNSTKSALSAIGQLYSHGHAVDFTLMNQETPVLTDLPHYPWDHSTEYWEESRISKAWRSRNAPHHELLGSRCLEANDVEPAWRNIFRLYNVPWIADHKLADDVLFPLAGFVAMMGEAIRQITGSGRYSLQNLMMKSGMLIPEADAIEIMTTMRPARLTEVTNSSWYDISVYSFNGSVWVQHCVAQGKGGENKYLVPLKKIAISNPSQIPESTYYKQLRHKGLDLGPRFQNLRDISASIEKQIVTASVKEIGGEPTARYTAHPFLLDVCFQLPALVSSRDGLSPTGALKIPSNIRRIDVNLGGADCTTQASVKSEVNGTFTADIAAFTKDNEVAVRIDGASYQLVDMEIDSSLRGNSQTLARMEWHRHIDFCEPESLIHPAVDQRDAKLALQKATALLILRMLHQLKTLEASSPAGNYLGKYLEWLQSEELKMLRGEWDSTIPEAKIWASSTDQYWDEILDSVLSQIDEKGDGYGRSFVHLARGLMQPECLQAILSGKTEAADKLAETAEIADVFHYSGDTLDAAEFLHLTGHSKPAQRVLQIGAGASAATTSVLVGLTSTKGDPLFSEYTVTDKSPKVLLHAEERLKDRKELKFTLLDISKDPSGQGFDLHSYDLIVTSSAFDFATPLAPALKNLRSLLRPEGRLFLRKPATSNLWRFIPFTMGLLPQWWSSEKEDSQAHKHDTSTEIWDAELRKAGFHGVQAAVPDDDDSYHLNSIIISKADVQPPQTRSVTMLYDTKKHDFALQLASVLEKQQINIHWRNLSDLEQIEGDDDIISTIDLEQPFFYNFSEESYSTFLEYLRKLKTRLVWLTRPAQVRCTDPRYGLVPGFARNVRLELGLHLFTVELDVLDSTVASLTASIIQRGLYATSLSAIETIDYEFSVFDNAVHVGRYHWLPIVSELEPLLENSEDSIKRLVIGRYGLISSLHWAQHEQKVLGTGTLEVEVRWDLMITMGLVPGAKDSLGIEASGVVTRVSDEVSDFVVGDEVMVMASGTLATRIIVSEANVAHILKGFSLEESAAIPTAVGTAGQALVKLGQLRKGESILIHTACGNVGLTALAISQMIGAEIYATVGSEMKIQHLMNNYGIPRERIFSSRDASFYDGIMQATDGRGVDLVLNSLSGELLHASWRCVAKNGKMMEIGKRDMIERGHLPLEMFSYNRSFFGIDLEAFAADGSNGTLTTMFQAFENAYKEGKLKPLEPRHIFTVEQVPDALRFLRLGQHIGKVLIKLPDDEAEISAIKTKAISLLSETSTYLMVGGMGGLGKAVALWMVENGARNFVFLSRSAGKSLEDQQFIRNLEASNCCAVAVAGSVAQQADVQRAISAAPSPIAGVIQMSMLIRDVPFSETNYENWVTGIEPKVKGTWTLHHALSEAKLDFFILFSSVVGLWGQPGQANYAAGNTFLGSFVQYRHSLGLPCSVIDLGAVEDVGFLSQNSNMLKHYRGMNIALLHETEVLRAVEVSIRRSKPDTTKPGPRGGYANLAQFAVGLTAAKGSSHKHDNPLTRDIRTSLFRGADSVKEDGDAGIDADVKELIKSLATEPELLYDPEVFRNLAERLGILLHAMMMMPTDNVDITASLSSLGIDSLHSVEIRDRLRRMIGMDVNILDIKNSGTIEGLARLIVAKLEEKFGLKSDRKK